MNIAETLYNKSDFKNKVLVESVDITWNGKKYFVPNNHVDTVAKVSVLEWKSCC